MAVNSAVVAVNCPKCGSTMNYRPKGNWGPWYSCSRHPRCKGSLTASKVKASQPKAPAAPRKPVVGSAQQQAIWSAILAQAAMIIEGRQRGAIASGLSHLVVRAFAGTGKSFTCREALWQLSQAFNLRCLYVAFSKAIVEEFKGDLPEAVSVRTLNGQGHSICGRNYGRVELNDDKVSDIFDELCPVVTDEEKEKARRLLRSVVRQIVALCQAYIYNGSKEQIDELAERHEVEIETDQTAQVYDLVPKVLLFCQHRTKVISFNDQLWLPVVNKLSCEKFDMIFVDEAQDLNRCQQQLIKRLLADDGIVVAVGDDNQAIFGFRGSDVDSINNLSALLSAEGRPVVDLPLSVSRRCPKSIIAQAQHYVPQIEALPDAPEGEIINTNLEAADALYQPGDLLICRTNAPLCSVAFGIIKRGQKAVIRGRDIGGGLIALVNRLDAGSVNELFKRLDDWRQRELAKIVGTRREETKAQNINDRADCILALAQDCDTVDQIVARIADVFADFDSTGKARGAVVLSSIHRAKGLEADNVFWLCPEISIKAEQEWQQRQERNLAYVALTRARCRLYKVAGKQAKQAKAA